MFYGHYESDLVEFISDHLPGVPYEEVAWECFGAKKSFPKEVFRKAGAANVVNGCTKAVLFFNEVNDVVFKIPLIGYKDAADNRIPYSVSDLCRIEVGLYEKALHRGVEKAFTDVCYLGLVNGYPIYAYPRVDVMFSDIDLNNSSCESDMASDRVPMDSEHLFEFLRVYGKTFFDRFVKFLEDFEIDDLHCDNIGYIENNPVVLDYSGFGG